MLAPLVELSNRFHWVFCQLETLQHCLPSSVWCMLDELPESLDKTYECMLKEIKRPNRGHAQCLVQCLIVAVWPLHIDELAEVLAVGFNDEEGVLKLKPDWYWEDKEQVLLSSCSSLILIINIEESCFVQFSHFSVKEFLTSPCLATSSQDVSWYHIALETAHVVLAQSCWWLSAGQICCTTLGQLCTVRECVNASTKGNGMSV